MATQISDNGISRVWRDGKYVFKQQPKHMTQNEIWCLDQMYRYGHVPAATRVDVEIIRMEFIERYLGKLELGFLLEHARMILEELDVVGIRHGDLTEYAVIPSTPDGVPKIVDFAESRLDCDPRPDKRPEGDRYWLTKTMRKIANEGV